jgi:hypothetical protein
LPGAGPEPAKIIVADHERDGRAKIKALGVLLGIQSTCARCGRDLLGSLTTVTASLRDLKAESLEYRFAELAAATAGPGERTEYVLQVQAIGMACHVVAGRWTPAN